jgi:hypothetical protein
MFISAGIVAAIRIFYFDHFRPKIRECLRARGPRNNAGKIHDDETVESGRHALCSWGAFR